MDRNVVRYKSKSKDALGVETTTTTPDPPAHEKLLKYFPEAALALYIAVDPVLRQLLSDTATRYALWVLLAVTLGFCWAYLTKFWKLNHENAKDNPHYVRQKVISEVALVSYISAIGGPFATQWTGYNTLWGTLASILITSFIVFTKAPEAPTTA